jgi:hypothetical protein
MATTERTAKALTYTGSGSQAAEIASLRTAISSGNTIFANDLNRIGTLINNMNGHYHTYDDAYQLATYGNTGDRNNYYEDKNTGTFIWSGDVGLTITNVETNTAANTAITVTRHNELKQAINLLRSHLHQIDDRTA